MSTGTGRLVFLFVGKDAGVVVAWQFNVVGFLGFSEEELRSKHCVDFSPKEDAERDWTLFQQLQAGTKGAFRFFMGGAGFAGFQELADHNNRLLSSREYAPILRLSNHQAFLRDFRSL